ncbi:NepR family anti-sigma factor [Brucellaceae bacterium C25G]
MTINKNNQATNGLKPPSNISAVDELGPNCEVGNKLRALYTSIQEEAIPDKFLDLLEKLDMAEKEYRKNQDNIGGG